MISFATNVRYFAPSDIAHCLPGKRRGVATLRERAELHRLRETGSKHTKEEGIYEATSRVRVQCLNEVLS